MPSDDLRSALLSEFDLGNNIGNDPRTFADEEVGGNLLLTSQESSHAVSNEALRRAQRWGVDPKYFSSETNRTKPSLFSLHLLRSQGSDEMGFLDVQIEAFISQLSILPPDDTTEEDSENEFGEYEEDDVEEENSEYNEKSLKDVHSLGGHIARALASASSQESGGESQDPERRADDFNTEILLQGGDDYDEEERISTESYEEDEDEDDREDDLIFPDVDNEDEDEDEVVSFRGDDNDDDDNYDLIHDDDDDDNDEDDDDNDDDDDHDDDDDDHVPSSLMNDDDDDGDDDESNGDQHVREQFSAANVDSIRSSNMDIFGTQTPPPTSVRARLMAIELPTSLFQPLLLRLKETRPTLYQLLKNHPIITNSQSTHDATSQDEGGSKGTKKSSSRISRMKITPKSWSVYRQYLAIAIVKCIAEGTTTSYLLGYHLLQQLPLDNTTMTLPIANVLAALFTSTTIETSSTVAVSEGKEPNLVREYPNPFASSLLRSTDAPSMFLSINQKDSEERLTCEPTSESPTAAGTAPSASDGDIAAVVEDVEELDDEELLMQALAMSLSSTADTVKTGSCEPEDPQQVESALDDREPPVEVTEVPTVDSQSSLLPFYTKSYWDAAVLPEETVSTANNSVNQPLYKKMSATPLSHVSHALIVALGISADAYLQLDLKTSDSPTSDDSSPHLTPQYPLAPTVFNNPLIPHLLESIMSTDLFNLESKVDEDSSGDKIVPQYLPMWSLTILLKLTRAFFRQSRESFAPLTSLDSSSGIVQRMANLLVEVIGADIMKQNFDGNFKENRLDSFWKMHEKRHNIFFNGRERMSSLGIHVLVAGFTKFHPSGEERGKILNKLFDKNEVGGTSVHQVFLQSLCSEMALWEDRHLSIKEIATQLIERMGRPELGLKDTAATRGEYFLLQSCHNKIVKSILVAKVDVKESDVSFFLKYSEKVLSICDNIMTTCLGQTDGRNLRLMSSHFLIAYILASLGATIVDAIRNDSLFAKRLINILGGLIKVLKKLFKVQSLIGREEKFGLSIMSGRWSVMNSSEEYYSMMIEATGDTLYANLITKQGKPISQTMGGVVTGRRLRMTAGVGSEAVSLECRLSLDGRHFSGNLKDSANSNLHSGLASVEGFFVGGKEEGGTDKNSETESSVSGTATLVTMAVTEILSHLGVGFDELSVPEAIVKCPAGHDMTKTIGVPDTYRTMRGPTVNCDPCGMRNLQASSESYYHCSKCKYDVCPKCSIVDVHPKSRSSEVNFRWLNHRLLAGGLSSPQRIEEQRYSQSHERHSALLVSMKIENDSLDWWLEQIYSSPNAETMLIEDIPTFSSSVDDWVQRTVPPSPLCKLGGECLEKSRKRIILACLKHVGFLTKYKELCSTDLSIMTPSEEFSTIWRTAQLIIEHSIRTGKSSDEENFSYTRISEDLLQKCDFLIELIRSNTSKDDINTFSKELGDVQSFLQCRDVDLENLVNRMLKSTRVAVLRAVAFKSALLLFEDLRNSPLFLALIGAGLHNAMGMRYRSFLFPGSNDNFFIIDTFNVKMMTQTHYSKDIPAVGHVLNNLIRELFEDMYRMYLDTLRGNDKKVDRGIEHLLLQLFCLQVKPEDYSFLLECGILKLIQEILDGSRGKQGPIAKLGKLALLLGNSFFSQIITNEGEISRPQSTCFKLLLTLSDIFYREICMCMITLDSDMHEKFERLSFIMKTFRRSSWSPSFLSVLSCAKWLTSLVYLSKLMTPQILRRRVFAVLRSVLTVIKPIDVHCLMDISTDANTIWDNDSIVEKTKTMKNSSAFNLIASYIEVIGNSKDRIGSSESNALIRLLLSDLEWAETIHSVIMKNITTYHETSGCIHECISSLGILGARFESIFVGGVVNINPLVLAQANAQSESITLRVTAASHTSGFVIAHASGGSRPGVEVVLAEQKSMLKDKNKLEIHTVTTQPTRVVKLRETDVVPTGEVSPPQSIPSELGHLIMNILRKQSLPAMKSSIAMSSTKFSEDEKAGESESNDGKENSPKDLIMSYEQYLMSVAVFKSISQFPVTYNSGENENEKYILSSEDLKELLAFSTQNVSVGCLSSLESLESLFSKICEAYEAPVVVSTATDVSGDRSTVFSSTPPLAHFAPVDDTAGANAGASSTSVTSESSTILNIRRRVEVDENAIQRASSDPSNSGDTSGDSSAAGGPSRLREAIFSSNHPPPRLLSMFGLGRPPADPTASIQQMLEMGFPREWCEFALRRCGYNVELAINLCFERSAEMSQLIEEERELSLNDPLRLIMNHRRFGETERERPRDREPARERTQRQPISADDALSLLSELLPRSLTQRDSSEVNGRDDTESPVMTTSSTRIPLGCIAGSANISDDYICQGSSSGGFPSVGCRGFGANSGKWYYEVTLLTAGCIQMGWIDSHFVADTDKGEGVGDDGHSWAFDGWRIYLWHELSLHWGTKWAIGDVVGCAVDLDNNSMSFFLNGYGEEVGMGLAFQNFEYSGGMHPGISFNRHEKVQVNLGYTSFKYPPPEGYVGFSVHIENVILTQSIKTCSLSSTFEKCILEQDKVPSLVFEDCLEDARNDIDFNWKKRYFASAENGHFLSSRSLGSRRFYPLLASSDVEISKNDKEDKSDIVKRLAIVAGDLCILYSRLALLRFLCSRDCSKSRFQELMTTLCDIENGNNCEDSSVFSKLLRLIRISCTHTCRTKGFIDILSHLPTSNPPSNVGSAVLAGGAPLLHSIDSGFKILYTVAKSSHVQLVIIRKLVEMVSMHTKAATLREFAAHWTNDHGTFPSVLNDTAYTDVICENTPSLHFAHWISWNLLFLNPETTPSVEERQKCVYDLCESWAYVMRSPNVQVKLSAARFLSSLIQEFSRPNSPLCTLSCPLDLIEKIVPLGRLEAVLKSRLQRETNSCPIHSEYVQALVELIYSIKDTRKHNIRLLSVIDAPELLSSEDEDFETLYGHAQADYGYETLSGYIHQLEISQKDGEVKSTGWPKERYEAPPECFPGCRVQREVRKWVVEATIEEEGGKKNSGGGKSKTKSKDSPSESLPTFQNDDDHHHRSDESNVGKDDCDREESSGDSTAASGKLELSHELGVVIAITAWENKPMGTARKVKWDGGEESEIKWGADGEYEAELVVVAADGKVTKKYPHPLSPSVHMYSEGFGRDMKFGILLRRKLIPTTRDDGVKPFKGFLEMPDFSSVILVSGEEHPDGRWTLREEKLLEGPRFTGWSCRFGHSHWRPGTTYELCEPSHPDPMQELDGKLLGEFEYMVSVPSVTNNVLVMGNVHLQRKVLFTFDESRHVPTIMLSRDKLTASFNGGRKGIAFANIGFSSGVHYWEFKIEQADFGSIFIGVSERSFPPSNHQGYSRWTGYGTVNRRISLKGNGSSSDNLAVYGENFYTGDTIGVMLDMNRGKLSFYVDGLKFGEHILADMGDAFDNLGVDTSRIRPKTFFPIVGMSKSLDRLAITSRWLSCPGPRVEETLPIVHLASDIVRKWNIWSEGQVEFPDILLQESFKDWKTWRSSRYVRVQTRCRAPHATVILDTHPESCVEASVYLGLTTALFTGDRIKIISTSGRLLDVPEEAEILGAFGNKLWYRLRGVKDGDTLVWCFAQHDFEVLEVLSRGSVFNSLPIAQQTACLARVPSFQGGFVRIVYESGAVMRAGLEIDNSEVVHSIERDAVVYALERRINSSNIARFRVFYKDTIGWISERIRGGQEEMMIQRIEPKLRSEDGNLAEVDYDSLLEEARSSPNLPVALRCMLKGPCVNRPEEAVTSWKDLVTERDYEESSEATPTISKPSFMDMAKCMNEDLKIPWSIDADMRIVKCISKTADNLGVEPRNLSFDSCLTALSKMKEKDMLFTGISLDALTVRASVLRVVNNFVHIALPYFSMITPEERVCYDYAGTLGEVAYGEADEETVVDNASKFTLSKTMICLARQLRSLRFILFTSTKLSFFTSVLDATTTPTMLPEDEYEDPREIKALKINRVKSTISHLTAVPNLSQRLKLSVFGQIHKACGGWSNASFRRSFLAKGHGGQRRAFKVIFQGEGVNDYGGPYRELFEQIVDELQYDQVDPSSNVQMQGSKEANTSQRCLFPLFLPCPNRVAEVGMNQDKYIPGVTSSALTHDLMNFFGKLVGMAVRHQLTLGLNLGSTFWRPLVRLPINLHDLESIDLLAVNNIKSIESVALANEKIHGGDSEYVPSEWAELSYTAHRADGSLATFASSLADNNSNGKYTPINLGNWRNYKRDVERLRLRESVLMSKAIREGLGCVLPLELFCLFDENEMEKIVTGSSTIDITKLRETAEYEDIDPSSPVVSFLWDVLEEMDSDDRTMFLRFVCARSRLSTSNTSSLQPDVLKIQGSHYDQPDHYLPHAQTCFFSLTLPNYSSKDILREKLHYAIRNSPNMDADVRLHNAEGW